MERSLTVALEQRFHKYEPVCPDAKRVWLDGKSHYIGMLITGQNIPVLMKLTPIARRLSVFVTLGILVAASGCHRQPDPQHTAAVEAKAEQKQAAQALVKKENTARDEIDQIPPPSKVRYLSVHTTDGWVNPFLTIHRDTVELRIIFPETTGSQLDGGSSLLHPAAARKQTVDVRLADLPDALSAIPAYAWPYGRVVAVQESFAAQRRDRVQVRRTEEATMKMLNDLGVVVDDWNGGSNTLLH